MESHSPEPTEPPSLKAMQALLDSGLTSFIKHVDSRLASHQEDMDNRLASHKKDMAELLDKTEARILDTLRGKMDVVQEDVVKMVHEEIAEVEDNVMRNLTEAPLSATLTFPQHPWY